MFCIQNHYIGRVKTRPYKDWWKQLLHSAYFAPKQHKNKTSASNGYGGSNFMLFYITRP